MLKTVLAISLLVLSPSSTPKEMYRIAWKFPTQYVDETPLPVEDIAGTELRCRHYGFWESRVVVNQPCPFPEPTFVPAPTNELVLEMLPHPREGGVLQVEARNVLHTGGVSKWNLILYDVWWPLPKPTRNLVVQEAK